jgi:hypothetical protein
MPTIKFARIAANRGQQKNGRAPSHRFSLRSLDALVLARPVEVQQETLGQEITKGEPQPRREQLNVSNLRKALKIERHLLNSQLNSKQPKQYYLALQLLAVSRLFR